MAPIRQRKKQRNRLTLRMRKHPTVSAAKKNGTQYAPTPNNLAIKKSEIK